MRCPVILLIDDQFGQCRPFAIIVEYGYLIFVGQTYQVPGSSLNNAQVGFHFRFQSGIVTHVIENERMLLIGHRESLCRYLYTSKHVFFLSFGSSQYHILRVGIQFFYQDIHRLVGSGHNTFVQHFLCIGHDFVFFHY